MEAQSSVQFGGIGPAVCRAVACVEALKRSIPGLHQHTAVFDA